MLLSFYDEETDTKAIFFFQMSQTGLDSSLATTAVLIIPPILLMPELSVFDNIDVTVQEVYKS